jgi:hypothetical protein
MPFGEIDDMDVIADCGAVSGWVVFSGFSVYEKRKHVGRVLHVRKARA